LEKGPEERLTLNIWLSGNHPEEYASWVGEEDILKQGKTV
jgi:hypothetical protein